MRNIISRLPIFVWFIGIAILMSCLVVLLKGSAGGGDHYVHYRIARFAPQHPYLYFDLWGKPLFTIIASVFAQFGIIGVKIMNALLGTASSYLLFRFLFSKYQIKAIWSAVFLLLMPTYFFLMNSAMTEILFSFLLMLAFVLMKENKLIMAAIVISLLPFARQEGYVLLPVFAVYFFIVKQYKLVPLLVTGIIIFSIAGGIYFNDLLWLIHQHPYPAKDGVYGFGHPLHFILHSEDIVGVPILILIAAGLLLFIYKREWLRTSKLQLLMYFVFFFFLLIHSFLWWKGKSGSMGLVRVMACVLPMITPLCLEVWEFILEKIKRNAAKLFFKLAFLAYLIFYLVGVQTLPISYSPNEKAVIELSHWIKSQNLQNRKWISTEVWLWYFLKRDPFDKNKMQEGFNAAPNYLSGLNKGDMILWENQFGLFHLPLETLERNTQLKLIAKWEPSQAVYFGKNEKLSFTVFEVVN